MQMPASLLSGTSSAAPESAASSCAVTSSTNSLLTQAILA